MRADKYLFENAFAPSRSKAAEMIAAGNVCFDGKIVSKPSFEIPDDAGSDRISLIGEICPYVSRGGMKLQAALDAFSINVGGKTCIDIGASTGGFTDCLLQSGAAHVCAVDCGHGQMDASLLRDERVTLLEGFNARNLRADTFGRKFPVAVMDVSFISQTLLYPAVSEILEKEGRLISLIKPQFEAGRDALSKNGIVRDTKIHYEVIRKLAASSAVHSLYLERVIRSPICGGDGNREYLALFGFGTPKPTDFSEIKKTCLENTAEKGWR